MIRPLLAAAAVFALLAAACASDDLPHSGTSSPTTTPAPGCSPARAPAAADTRHTVVSDSRERGYLLHVPPAYDGGTAAPLVIALHAEATTAGHLRMLTELDSAVDERGTIAVYPEGSDELGLGVWNAESFASGLDDSLFLSDLLDVLAEELCVNEARVYVAGMSQGGAMALRFACDAPERVAAVSPVAAPYVACQAPVPMVAFHGSKDPLVPYEGGVSPLTGQPSPPVHRAASEWARALGCDGLATISRPTADVELATYRNCSGSGADVLLYNAIEGGHTWPGATIDAPEENAGKTTRSISATELMLDFFERQQR